MTLTIALIPFGLAILAGLIAGSREYGGPHTGDEHCRCRWVKRGERCPWTG